MSHLIKGGKITESDYPVIPMDDASTAQGNALLPLAFYIQHAAELKGRNDVGVWLACDEEVETLAPYLDDITLVGLDFPAFSDGRAYSSAVMLRKHYGFEGEIRAIGDVRADQLEQMRRCGFDSYELAEGQDPEFALGRLAVFTRNYQSTIDETGIIHERAHS